MTDNKLASIFLVNAASIMISKDVMNYAQAYASPTGATYSGVTADKSMCRIMKTIEVLAKHCIKLGDNIPSSEDPLANMREDTTTKEDKDPPNKQTKMTPSNSKMDNIANRTRTRTKVKELSAAAKNEDPPKNQTTKMTTSNAKGVMVASAREKMKNVANRTRTKVKELNKLAAAAKKED
jgi:hypothetical protein